MSSKHPFSAGFFAMAALAFCTLAFSGAASKCRADDKAYTIKLFHASHVGDKYDYTFTGFRKVRNDITVAGQPPINQPNDMNVQLQGTVEVLAVSANGSHSKFAVTVQKFLRTDQKPATEILPAGAIVTGETEAGAGRHKTHYTLKGGELSPEQTSALELAIKAKGPDEPTDDEVFGTATPQKVGGTWAIDKAKIAADAAKSGIPLTANDLVGQSRLSGTTTIDGREYLQVKTDFSAPNLQVPLPNGMKVEACKMDAKLSGLFPADGGNGKITETVEMNMDMRAKGNANGAEMAVHTSMQMQGVHETTPKAAK